jgi:hypothetical protein
LRLGVAAASVRSEFSKSSRSAAGEATPDDEYVDGEVEAEVLPRPAAHEFHLLKLLLLHEELAEPAAMHLNPDWVQHPLVREIVARRFAAQQNAAWRGLAAFLDECEAMSARSLITEAATEERKIPNPELQLSDLILKLRNQYLDRQLAAQSQKMSQPGLADEERLRLMRDFQLMREQKRQPLAPIVV